MSNLKNNLASLQELIDKANALPEAKTLQSSKTVSPTTSAQTVTPDSGYDGLEKVTVNAMPTATLATPTIEVSSSGVVTAKVTQSTGGYIASGANKSATKNLTTQGAKTITPSKLAQDAVVSGRYTTGDVIVAPIPAQYITTTDATATAEDIVEGETGYVNGVKVTGTNPYEKTATDTEVNGQADLIEQISAALAGKSVPGGGSGGVETCTVRLYNTDGHVELVGYTYIAVGDAGELVPTSVETGNVAEYLSFDITLENVLCGSSVIAVAYGEYDFDYETENAVGNYTLGNWGVWPFAIQAPSGGTATIELMGI